MNLFQFTDADLGVDRCRFEFHVAEHGLDVTHVGSVLQHERRHRVAEEVAGASLAHLGRLHVATDPEAELVRADRLAYVGKGVTPAS